MTDREGLEEQLDALETQFGAGPTHCVMAVGSGGEWPDAVDREDIVHRERGEPINGHEIVFEEVTIPIHRPPEYRGGIVMISPAEIAQIYDSMPDEIRERERERRIAEGKPIPPILQQ